MALLLFHVLVFLATMHVGPQRPDQVWNLQPLHWREAFSTGPPAKSQSRIFLSKIRGVAFPQIILCDGKMSSSRAMASSWYHWAHMTEQETQLHLNQWPGWVLDTTRGNRQAEKANAALAEFLSDFPDRLSSWIAPWPPPPCPPPPTPSPLSR